MRKLSISLVILVLSALVLSACSGSPAANSPAAPAAQQAQPASDGMNHETSAMTDNSYDVHFIDMTLHHHAGVVAMAEQALKESQTVTIKDLAQKAITDTQKEIEWLKDYRQKNHPNAAAMQDAMDMGAMSIAADGSKSFDQRYAEAMVSHHATSVSMAKEALTKAGHDDLKQFAQNMLAAEETEVTQLQQYIK